MHAHRLQIRNYGVLRICILQYIYCCDYVPHSEHQNAAFKQNDPRGIWRLKSRKARPDTILRPLCDYYTMEECQKHMQTCD